NTIEDAATARVRDRAGRADDLPLLTQLVDSALLANLACAIPGLMTRLQEVAALSSDVAHMMEALPPLANVLRYSSVRRTDRRMGLALSTAGDPAQAAAWVEGFLKGSGLVLLHDQALLGVVDNWLTGLPADTFTTLVPLLRRTFSTFTPPERRQIGEWARYSR